MKYLFKIFPLILWMAVQTIKFLWHFNFKHLEGYNKFYEGLDIDWNIEITPIDFAVACSVLCIISAVLGFGLLIGGGLFKILFLIFLILFVLSLITSAEKI